MSRRLLSVADILKLHEPPWLVDRILPARSLGMLWGPTNLGKSFVTLDLACSITSGIPFCGKLTDAGPVVYVVGEGVIGYKRRLRAWMEYHELKEDKLADLHFMSAPIQLHQDGAGDRFVGLVKVIEPVLIVIDTLAASSLGIDEDKTIGIGPVLDALLHIRKELSTAVLVVHHTGWEGKHERGSSGLRAAMDVSIELAGGDKLHRKVRRRRLVCHKQRDVEKFDDLPFRLEEVFWETKYGVSKSLVVQHGSMTVQG